MNRRMLAGGLLIALILFAWTTGLPAKNGIVRTKDGRTIEGDVTDKGNEGVTIKTRIATVTLTKDDVQSITYAENIKDAYEQRLKALPKDATARHHIEIARWLFENREYDLARKELDKALTLDPNSAEAATLKQTVARTEALDRGRQPNGDRPPVNPPPDRERGATRPALTIRPSDRRLLEPEDINTIRQLELNERADRNSRIRVNFSNDVKRRFIDYDNRDAREFNSMTPFAQAWEILRNGTQEMRKDVKVLGDPAAIAEFRSAVQPTVLQGCATTGCHGGTNAGKFVLYSPADNDGTTYTNFYILTQYAAETDGGNRKAIDRLHPNNSLVLQFGLPRDRAEFDHPEAPGWAPIYRDTQDPRFRRIADWMKNSLAAVEPKYDINYTLPGSGDAEKRPEGRPAENRPPARDRQTAPPSDQRGENNNRNSRDDARNKTDEARERIRPGRGGVPGVGGIGGI